MSKREETKAIEDTKKVAGQAKSVEDKLEAVETLQEVGIGDSTRISNYI